MSGGDNFVRDSTHEEFTHELCVQNDHLWMQLGALRRAPRKTWRKLRLHEVVCASCDRSVVEVMDTRPYPTVLHRMPCRPGGISGWGWFPISDPPPDGDSEQARHGVLVSVCDCRQVTLPLGPIFDALRRGEPKRVLPPATVY